MCVWGWRWLYSPFFVCGGLLWTGCHFERCCLWASGSTLAATGECGELRKECELHLTECDRRKMTGFGPGIRMPCVCVCARAHTHTHNPHTLRTHAYTLCHGKVGTSTRGQFDLFHQTQITVYLALFLTHTHTHSPNQLGFLRRGQNKVIWACEWLSQSGCDSQDSCY